MAYEARLTQAAQDFHEGMFPGYTSDFLRTDPEFIERFDNFAFDEVVNTVNLDETTRYLGWLSTLLGCQGIDEFRAMVPAALRNGLTPVQLKEVVYQATAYLGIGRTFPFLKAVNEALEAAGVELPLEPQATTTPDQESRLAGGERAQVGCFGDHMKGYKDAGNPDYPQINVWLVDNCFGDYYTRGGLDLAQRELVTFCILVAQGGCDPQARGHAAGNFHVGNSREFLIRVISSNLPFIGYPRSLNAIAAVEAAWEASQK